MKMLFTLLLWIEWKLDKQKLKYLKDCEKPESTAITFICTTPKLLLSVNIALAIEPFSCLSCAFQTNFPRVKKRSLSFYCFVPTLFNPFQVTTSYCWHLTKSYFFTIVTKPSRVKTVEKGKKGLQLQQAKGLQ